MSALPLSYTTEKIFKSLGYPDPLVAARQQARMILLGRRSRYQAEIQQLQAKWHCNLDEMRQKYQAQAHEDFAADEDYLSWQWYDDAIKAVDEQLDILARE